MKGGVAARMKGSMDIYGGNGFSIKSNCWRKIAKTIINWTGHGRAFLCVYVCVCIVCISCAFYVCV